MLSENFLYLDDDSFKENDCMHLHAAGERDLSLLYSFNEVCVEKPYVKVLFAVVKNPFVIGFERDLDDVKDTFLMNLIQKVVNLLHFLISYFCVSQSTNELCLSINSLYDDTA